MNEEFRIGFLPYSIALQYGEIEDIPEFFPYEFAWCVVVRGPVAFPMYPCQTLLDEEVTRGHGGHGFR